MNIGNKYIVAIIAAAATGLPQGINASPLQGMAEVIPADTVYIITKERGQIFQFDKKN